MSADSCCRGTSKTRPVSENTMVEEPPTFLNLWGPSSNGWPTMTVHIFLFDEFSERLKTWTHMEPMWQECWWCVELRRSSEVNRLSWLAQNAQKSMPSARSIEEIKYPISSLMDIITSLVGWTDARWYNSRCWNRVDTITLSSGSWLMSPLWFALHLYLHQGNSLVPFAWIVT